MPPEAIDLASRLLQYSPSLRCTAVSWPSQLFKCNVCGTLLCSLSYLNTMFCSMKLSYDIMISEILFAHVLLSGAEWSITRLLINLYVIQLFPFVAQLVHFSCGLLQLEACAHPFFDELREPNVRLPNGRPLPPLFNLKQEVSASDLF